MAYHDTAPHHFIQRKCAKLWLLNTICFERMVHAMHLLTMDTSQGTTSLALWREKACVATFQNTMPGTQASALIPQIQTFMAEAGVTFAMLDGIGCITGPGGFTSVRIGVATARGLGFAANIPVWGVSMPEIMAWYAHHHAGLKGTILCALPAGNRDLCIQPFDLDTALPLALGSLQLIAREGAAFPHPCCAPVGAELEGCTVFPVAKSALFTGELLLHVPDLSAYLSPVPLYAKPADAVAAPPFLSLRHS